jgi:hypothetical protein
MQYGKEDGRPECQKQRTSIKNSEQVMQLVWEDLTGEATSTSAAEREAAYRRGCHQVIALAVDYCAARPDIKALAILHMIEEILA